ncbi:hypothetical protein EDB95_1471 [Dinghuibacter silviterrae]|uniref:Uncharacterized protein n=1 Tax=Dinghuibacter silviterrae TaxID=1539049 RepID=A0A4R8DSS5_9BACT|nr:hypothetical protein EDB95_1471 [Dinghuibacter silviterrae]
MERIKRVRIMSLDFFEVINRYEEEVETNQPQEE